MKRLLLLSSLIFGLALSGCGNDPNGTDKDPTKAKLGEICTKEKACNTGLACVLASGQTDKGKCETACDENDACSDNKKCKTDVAGLEGKTVKVCRAGSVQGQEKATLGQPCSESKQCADKLVCVADANETKIGTCYDACETGDKCAKKADVCIEVDGLNNKKEKACRTPPPVQVGQECKVGEKCQDGSHCIAKVGRPDVGVCTEAVDCTSDPTICTKPNEVCQKERVLKGAPALSLCGEKWCTEDSNCETTEFCMVSATDQSRGHCTKRCDDTLAPCPNGEKCTRVSTYATGFTTDPNTCLPNEVADKVALGRDGCDTTACRDEGAICVKDGIKSVCTMPCTIPGYNIECKSRANQYNRWCQPFDGKLGCGPNFGLPKTKGENEKCGGLDLCDDSKDLYCKLNSKEGNEGICIKVEGSSLCSKDADCTNPGETCQAVIEEGFLYGKEYSIKRCQK